jgi:phosphomannomutase
MIIGLKSSKKFALLTCVDVFTNVLQLILILIEKGITVRVSPSLMMSVSGIRGLVGAGMNPEVAARCTAAFASQLEGGIVVIGRDTRRSGAILRDAVGAALRFGGFAVVDLGIVSTPTVEIMVRELGASGGVIITASHNGPEWNALKFLGRDGEFLSEDRMERLKAAVVSDEAQFPVPAEFGALRADDTADAVHIKKILELPLVDREAVSSSGFTAAVDCVNGAGSRIIPALLDTLGVTVIELNTSTDAPFPHDPEPRPDVLCDLSRVIRESKADIGFATDPDADRLVLADGGGRILSEELTLAVAADFVLERQKGPVVANMSTSRLLDWLGSKHGVPVLRTRVGEAHVVAGMKEAGAVIGGEGNGGVIYPELHYGRDAMVGIALTLQAITESGTTIAERVAGMPEYHIVKRKVPAGGSLQETFGRLEREFRGRTDVTDGLRIDMDSGWIHVRPSNTEPVVRIIAEAGSSDMAAELAGRVGEIIGSID